MKFFIEIDLGNAAFDDLPEYEIERILKETARKVRFEGLGESKDLYDYNGNACGRYGLKGKGAE